MLTRIKTTISKLFLAMFECYGLTVVQIDLPRLREGDWFSIKKIIRNPQDGSWRGDLFRADKVEGAFVACTRFNAGYGVGGPGNKMCLLRADYEIQTLTKAFVLMLRPELNSVTR